MCIATKMYHINYAHKALKNLVYLYLVNTLNQTYIVTKEINTNLLSRLFSRLRKSNLYNTNLYY